MRPLSHVPPISYFPAGIDPGDPMQYFEYQVIPAPKKGEKAKGAKTTPDRFAVALTNLMNRMGGGGLGISSL